MRNLNVARRYAKALFEFAVQTKTLDDVLLGMQNIATALKDEPRLGKLLFNPVLTPEEKQKLIKCITSNKLILKFVMLLTKRKRLDLFNDVYEHLLFLSDQIHGIHRVLVKTAAALSEVHRKMVEKELAQKFGGKILGQFEVAKELIGGVWVKMGDKVLDVTLKGRIDDLRHALLHSTN